MNFRMLEMIDWLERKKLVLLEKKKEGLRKREELEKKKQGKNVMKREIEHIQNMAMKN